MSDQPVEIVSPEPQNDNEVVSSTKTDHNPHKLICWPPKAGLQALARGLGTKKDVVTMMLWKENFYLRMLENEIGFCVRNAFVCFLPIIVKLSRSGKEKTREQQTDPNVIEERGAAKNYAYGDDALAHYNYLHKLESRLPRNAGGPKKTTYQPNYIIEQLRAKETEIQNLPEEDRKKSLKELERIYLPKHHHSPWFTTIISVVHLLVLIVTMAIGNIAPLGVEPKIELVKGVTTFRGIEDYDIWHRPNIWIGPTLGDLISFGAIYAPCMRTDELLTIILLSQPHGWKGELGCCVVEKHEIAGTTTQGECHNLTMGGGTWYNQVCSKHKPSVKTILRPCCFGFIGSCKMTTQEGCKAHKGHYFSDTHEHCSQVFCFPHFCGKVGIDADEEWPFMPGSFNQGWRYLSSIFLHAGVIHYMIVLIVYWTIGRPIEAAIGHIRIALVYFTGAIGGNLVASFFDPYLPQVGCSGGIFTLIGISYIEVFQALHHKKKKYIFELLFLTLLVLFIILSGFFPFINNFAHFGGLLFGLPVALAIMPHLCFNKWSYRTRRVILILSIILLVVFVILFIILFYEVQQPGFWENCYYFSCIPFTENVCNVLVELQGTLSHD